ncbi:hypothetical protein [Thalassospira tepidiphila]|uniref:hypothetical protein n=1 Tax=Thalassospira tepidiphila TaxID=393657 RepID=UPI003AA7BBE9
MNLVESFLRDSGPATSTAVSQYLVENHKLTPSSARKRVSRAAGNVRRLAYLTFPRNSRFLYLESQFGSNDYWNNLIAALQSTNSCYGHAIAALRQRNGFTIAQHFEIICGAPKRLSKHLSPNTILARLEKSGLVQIKNITGLGECVSLVQTDDHYEMLASETKGRLAAEKLLLIALTEWLKKLGLVSFDKVSTRDSDERRDVGPFAWDLTAPSYLSCFKNSGRSKSLKQGFVTLDVCLADKISYSGIRPFVNKCQTLQSLKNIPTSLQIYVANNYEKDAFKLLKAHGIVPATTKNLFGEEIAAALSQLASVITDTFSHGVDPIKFDMLFSTLGKIEGAAIQLRGTLFEYLVADYVRKELTTAVKMNHVLTAPSGKKAEADIVAIKDDKSVTFIECKGYNPKAELPDSEIDKWLTNRIPTIFSATKTHPEWKNLKIHFELWCTGKLSSKSIGKITQAKQVINPRRYTIGYRLSDELLDLFEQTNNNGLIEAFKKHFTVR